MIDWAKQHSIRIWRQGFHCRVKGAELAFFPIMIDDDFGGRQRDAFSNDFRVGTEHDTANSDC